MKKVCLPDKNHPYHDNNSYDPTDDNYSYDNNYKHPKHHHDHPDHPKHHHDHPDHPKHHHDHHDHPKSNKQNAPGQNSQYMLRSSIVPPVCPACPPITTCPNNKKCPPCPRTAVPPCPPCARCPEDPFKCVKVPNYESTDRSNLPRPLLNDFSQFDK